MEALRVVDPNDFIVIDFEGVREGEPMIDGGEFVLLLGFCLLGGLEDLLALSPLNLGDQNILIIPVTVQNSDVQNCNFMDLFGTKGIASIITNAVLVLHESLE